MGVWERSPAGIAISMRNPGLLEDFRRALPDFAAEDNVGSPYCVRRYVVDEHLGGPQGLAAAREACSRTRPAAHPRFCARTTWRRTTHGSATIRNTSSRGTPTMRADDPASFIEAGGTVFACGRDPYFPAWPDVLQLNAFQPGLRQAVIETVAEIAGQCDGIRCDMAMLMLNNIFERTWGDRAGAKPAEDYWTDADPGDQGASGRSSGSSPRPTGTWSGSCSSRALITATTRNSTTGWNTGTPRACASTSWPISLTSRGWSGSSRTMTSPGPPPRFRTEKDALPPSRSSHSPGQSCCTRGSSREGR